ncbi:MAG: DUF4349 domain-containing protein [Lachnospiraceae bacterium]|jgi:hypothetical protein|nr:DUF4349 domain-containing protein [Lachnospiraceae bacterium]
MMRKRKTIGRGMVAMVAALFLTACSSADREQSLYLASTGPQMSSSNEGNEIIIDEYETNDVYYQDIAPAERAEEMSIAEEVPVAESAAGGSGDRSTPPTGDLDNRKLIKDANITVETEEFDALLTTVSERVERLGGYLENFNTSQNSFYSDNNEDRYASMTIRIPADQYEQLVTEVAEISNVLNRNESVRDVTMEYVDIESRKAALLTEQERLLELIAQAETIDAIIVIETRLSDIRYQLESMESQLRTYDSLVAYSTIYLSVNEVRELTPVQEQTTWERISAGFIGSWKALGNGLNNLLIGFVVVSPFLIFWAVIVGVILLVVRIIIRRQKQKKPPTAPNADPGDQNNKN